MASLQEALEQALENARKAQAKPATDELPDLREDPCFYLDLDHGAARLKRYLEQQKRRSMHGRDTR